LSCHSFTLQHPVLWAHYLPPMRRGICKVAASALVFDGPKPTFSPQSKCCGAGRQSCHSPRLRTLSVA
jgi:hypothetical protein